MLRAKVEELNEMTKELMNKVVSYMNCNALKSMRADELETLQLVLRTIDKSQELLEAEAEQLDRIEDKLDRLLKTK